MGNQIWGVVRRLGAIALLVVGFVHLQEYRDGYSEIDTIGVLFLLNFAAATAIGIGLLLPAERLIPRWGSTVVTLLALGGIGLSATSFVMLLIAERRPLFGFMEPGFDPDAIMLSRVSEIATVALLGAYVISRFFAGPKGAHRAAPPGRAADASSDRKSRVMHSVLGPAVLSAAALLLAACGGDDGNDSTQPGSVPEGATVAVTDIDGQSVLVNASGQALYVSDEEADGNVLCVSDGCLAFWEPLVIDSGEPTGDVSGELGTLQRPDGDNQVTLDGRPLYTFSEDSAGEVNGDGLSDTFDGQTLTWRVTTTTGTGTTEAPDDSGGYGY